jgi:transcriptional regulator with GAF, ATPase, and Fis domain/tetratricopeptide (TPR) repeat protein
LLRSLATEIQVAGAVRGLVVLDELLADPSAHGIGLVRLPSRGRGPAARGQWSEQTGPLCAHLARRARAVRSPGRSRAPRVLTLASPPDQSLWREVALRLGIADLPAAVDEAAERLWAVLSAEGAVVVGQLGPGSAWDASVADDLGQRALEAAGIAPGWAAMRAPAKAAGRGPLLILLLDGDEAPPASWAGAATYEIEATLDDEAQRRWWQAISEEGFTAGLARGVRTLGQLEALRADPVLRGALPQAANDQTPVQIVGIEDELLGALRLAARSWPIDRLGLLLEGASRGQIQAAIEQLEAAGRLQVFGGLRVGAEPQGNEGATAREGQACRVAAALAAEWPGDPWAQARAAELLAAAGLGAEAEAAHVRGVQAASDVHARADLWARWGRVVERFAEQEQQGYLLRAAELALTKGDADGALGWAERASRVSPEAHATLLIVGRASLGRGDLVTADVTLQRALEAAQTAAERARALAELAEVRYGQGRLDEAGQLATESLGLCPQAPGNLPARNTLGKLLLARGLWVEAEAHFADDASLAARSGIASAQLRARLNRAIAVMSEGRVDEARPMLEGVLTDGAAQGDERAVAFALSNLAVLAINRHDYSEALELSERAISARRRMGERLGLARVITNIAELRLRLGLVDEADQALSFGKLALSRTANLPRTAHFALLSARVHLARGQSIAALRELSTAIAGAPHSSDGDMLSECHRVAVRVALEDGDLDRGRLELEQAEKYSRTPSAQAEVAILRALFLRASGVEALEEAQQAVLLARRSGDEEFLRESHTLTGQIALAEGTRTLARSHLDQAALLRDHVASRLAGSLRASYLGRRDLVLLSRLERELTEVAAEEVPPSRPSGDPAREPTQARARGPRGDGERRTMTGEDPAIRGLLENIRKVGRTDATVLVLGESGTGKELVAEAIHEASPRREAALIKVNCGALVESLLLSELFGHEKGAFTGATGRKRGRFEMAEGGTLFLDEIGDISPATQVALLRVLQERTFERVGGSAPIRANVRIVCATHRDLRGMVERGEFRQDLYFRLTGIVLHVPALRSRMGDLPMLVRNLLQRIAVERGETPKSMAPESLSLLARHRWPGNIRELENALRAASLFADGPSILPGDLLEHVESLRGLDRRAAPEAPRETGEVESARPSVEIEGPVSGVVSSQAGAEAGADDAGEACSDATESSSATDVIFTELKAGKFGLFELKRQLERDCIARALAETRGNITRAAAILGMKRPRLSQLVKQYGLAAISSEGS